MLIGGGCYDVKGVESSFFYLVVLACHGQACGILDRILGKYHPQGLAESVCSLYIRILLKQYCSPLLLPVSPLPDRLEQEVSRAYEQFLTGISVGITERQVILSIELRLLHFIVRLLKSIPTVLDPKFLHGFTCQFLNVEPIYDTTGMGECRAYDFAHGVGQATLVNKT